jgi:hypothetical protein
MGGGFGPHFSFGVLNMAKEETTLKIQIIRDFWVEEDKRILAGEIVDLPSKTAKTLVNDGIAKLVLED